MLVPKKGRVYNFEHIMHVLSLSNDNVETLTFIVLRGGSNVISEFMHV